MPIGSCYRILYWRCAALLFSNKHIVSPRKPAIRSANHGTEIANVTERKLWIASTEHVIEYESTLGKSHTDNGDLSSIKPPNNLGTMLPKNFSRRAAVLSAYHVQFARCVD